MNIDLGPRQLIVQRVFCIGRNYRDHVRELSNEMPAEPIIFMKPATSLVAPGTSLRLPSHGSDFQFEAEMVVVIGKEGRACTPEQAVGLIAGLSLGLDLTMRDVQRESIAAGMPWETSKSFDQSAPVGTFVQVSDSVNPDRITFECSIRGVTRQRGNTADMFFPVPRLLMELSQLWTLLPGDLLFTGTPSGTGRLVAGDQITVASPQIGVFSWSVAET